MNTFDAILTRRSTRQFIDQPIAPETLHQILEAAMSGPCCVNARDWSFLVVTERETLLNMAEADGIPGHLFRFRQRGHFQAGARRTGSPQSKSIRWSNRGSCPDGSGPAAIHGRAAATHPATPGDVCLPLRGGKTAASGFAGKAEPGLERALGPQRNRLAASSAISKTAVLAQSMQRRRFLWFKAPAEAGKSGPLRRRFR